MVGVMIEQAGCMQQLTASVDAPEEDNHQGPN
jgi:hypothetical protein